MYKTVNNSIQYSKRSNPRRNIAYFVQKGDKISDNHSLHDMQITGQSANGEFKGPMPSSLA